MKNWRTRLRRIDYADYEGFSRSLNKTKHIQLTEETHKIWQFGRAQGRVWRVPCLDAEVRGPSTPGLVTFGKGHHGINYDLMCKGQFFLEKLSVGDGASMIYSYR